MRISGVTGDLPAVAAPPEPPSPVGVSAGAPPPAVAAAAAAADGGETGAHDHRRRPPTLQHCFDPPLIAQRAVLGLPVGMLISELAKKEGIPYTAACAAVDREMPRDAPAPSRAAATA